MCRRICDTGVWLSDRYPRILDLSVAGWFGCALEVCAVGAGRGRALIPMFDGGQETLAHSCIRPALSQTRRVNRKRGSRSWHLHLPPFWHLGKEIAHDDDILQTPPFVVRGSCRSFFSFECPGRRSHHKSHRPARAQISIK